MIHGIAGSIGSGKSHLQLKIALEMMNLKEKQLVTNFPLDREGLKEYAKFKKYNWLLKCLRYGGVTEMHAPKKLEELFLPESIVCLDEAGIFLNSREFQKTSKTLLADLCQSRKFGTDLIWCSQFLEQVDNQFRMLTQYWTHAQSMTIYDKKSRRPKLWWKRYYWMDSASYYNWNSSSKTKMNHLRTRFVFSYRYEGGFLNKADKMLFNCFDSFTRLDHVNSNARIETMYTCPLHIPNCRAVSNFGKFPLFQVNPDFSKLDPEYRDIYITEEEYDQLQIPMLSVVPHLESSSPIKINR